MRGPLFNCAEHTNAKHNRGAPAHCSRSRGCVALPAEVELVVRRAAAGEASFNYSKGDGWKVYKYENAHDAYYLEGTLALLDSETEWAYETPARRVHLIPRDGRDPNSLRVQARVQTYAIAMTDVSHLVVRDLHFFATTIYTAGESGATEIGHVTYHSLRFQFP